MTPHFPFSPDFNLRIGTQPLAADAPLLEVDDQYLDEIQLKRELLAQHHAYYFNALPDTEAAQQEAFRFLAQQAAKDAPTHFMLTAQNSLYNITLKEHANLSDAHAPLDNIGRHLQEDLILLNTEGIVVAGQLCFPSGWALDEKIGLHFLDVHAPLPPVTSAMIQTAGKFMERLPPGKTFTRNNWGFRLSDQLDLSSKHSHDYRQRLTRTMATLPVDQVGDAIYLRVEHQTLTRLPETQHTLFTIRTYHSSVREECRDVNRAHTMLSFLRGAPPELIEYKVMTPLFDALLVYLSRAAGQADRH